MITLPLAMKKEVLLVGFGEHLKKVMDKKGVSNAELAKRTLLDLPHIRRLIVGGTNPTLKTIIKLAEALDMNLDEFFKGFSYKK